MIKPKRMALRGIKKTARLWAGGLNLKTKNLLHVSQRTRTGDARDDNRGALRVVGRVGLVRHRVERLDVSRGTNEGGELSRRGTEFQEVLVSRRTELAHVVQHGLVLGARTNLLERGNG